MALHWQVLSYAAVAIIAILVYEAIRAAVKARLKRRFRRDLQRFLSTRDLYSQSFKFTNKDVVRQLLVTDPEVERKVLEYAEREGEDLATVRDKADGYIDEIVPEFNILSYFKVGYTVARAFIHSLYDPVVDRQRRRLLDTLPPDASPVYVMNHRSNVDFVLLSYVLAGKVSISYAVGEWARVWPLERLFKSFGSYFVRRGHKEDLYHKVLERYVQLLSKHGVVQAVFPEGGLTRDGRLLPPKLGLVTWLSRVELEPDFDRKLVFVPVGVNYDWVIEDKNLVKEAQGVRRNTGIWKKAYVVLVGPFVSLGLLVVNATRFLLGRLKLHGYASLSFGEPLVLRDWLEAKGVAPDRLDQETLGAHMETLGDALMERIGAAVPATPVPFVAATILLHPQERYPFRQLVQQTGTTVATLREHGVPLVVGEAFRKFRRDLAGLAEEEERLKTKDRPSELDDVTRGLVHQEETEALVRYGTEILVRNKILRRDGTDYIVRPEAEARLRYYANSLGHHLDKAWPIRMGPDGSGMAVGAPTPREETLA
ncbi:MAG: 1-acyl-sn-glycerol-3-phosphate acyltransferase [Euryarchaeota archaeon]|nr:1-acyl-sn-glycerol-3-phosphate acyltransferase [Euryarchaeota archaeon]